MNRHPPASNGKWRPPARPASGARQVTPGKWRPPARPATFQGLDTVTHDMRRCSALLLLAAAACGGGTTTGTVPKLVASVSLSSTSATLQVGATVTLAATALDASGNTIAGKSVAWSSSAPVIAMVAAGVVTAVSPGIATITATADSKVAQATITVTGSCGLPIALAVGELHTLTTTERSSLCLFGGTGGSEYVLIPFKGDTVSATVSLSFSATGTVAATTSPLLAGSATAALLTPSGGRERDLTRQRAFEAARRAQERRVLTPLMRSRTRGGVPWSNITGLPATPAVGTTVSMNVNVTDACINPSLRKARVAAVSTNAIILADTASPANGFTDADFASFATTFDTLIYPLDTAAFGAPTDIDQNGRIVIFFTPAVNALSKNGDLGYITGFFFGRDIFPLVAQPGIGIGACAGSNYGEMFYMPVVDAAQVYNRFFTSKDSVRTGAIATLAHEMQHLINDSRRLWVTNANDFEETWLDEGLSHLAEELLYYRVSGLSPKSDLSLTAVTASQALVDAINQYQVGNLGNYYDYLSAPEVHSPYAPNDSLETRGATWALLRYAIDQSPNASATYTRALINANLTGLLNFNAAFGAAIPGGLLAAARQMALANFTDDSGLSVDPKYAFPSWNFRSVLPALSQNRTFPLRTRQLTPSVPVAFPIRGGGAAYVRFGIGPNVTATVASTSGSAAVPATVELILIRTK